jgi:hypothetical protein
VIGEPGKASDTTGWSTFSVASGLGGSDFERLAQLVNVNNKTIDAMALIFFNIRAPMSGFKIEVMIRIG